MVVRWTRPAAADLTHICDYTEQRFGVAQARRVAVAVCEAVESLGAQPSRGRRGRKAGTRELILPGFPFLIVYRLRRSAIEITRVLHGAQRWPI